MKERGLIVNDAEARGVADGSITEIRRVVKKTSRLANGFGVYTVDGTVESIVNTFDGDAIDAPEIQSPFGQPGGRLYLRETWQIESWYDGDPIAIGYKHGPQRNDSSTDHDQCYDDWRDRMQSQSIGDCDKAGIEPDVCGIYYWEENSPTRWRSPATMPKWAARTRADVKRVWVERLQDIREAGAVACGFTLFDQTCAWCHGLGFVSSSIDIRQDACPCGHEVYAMDNFKSAWDKKHGGTEYESARNPWLWCCEIEKVTT